MVSLLLGVVMEVLIIGISLGLVVYRAVLKCKGKGKKEESLQKVWVKEGPFENKIQEIEKRDFEERKHGGTSVARINQKCKWPIVSNA